MKKIGITIIFLTVCFTVFVWARSSWAANWYVDKDAHGTYDGRSWSNAFSQLCAYDASTCPHGVKWGTGGVSPGDTLYISGGQFSQTYVADQNGYFPIDQDGTNDRRITIATGAKDTSAGHENHGGKVIFDGACTDKASGSNGYVALLWLTADYVTIDGEKDGASNWKFQNTGYGGESGIDAAVIAYSAVKPRLLYLEIEDANNGIAVQACSSPEVAYCTNKTIRGNYSISMIASDLDADDFGYGRIHHNIIRGGSDPDKSGYGADGLWITHGADVYNNLFEGETVATWQVQHSDMIQGSGIWYVRIFNNTFHNIWDSAIDMGGYPGQHPDDHDWWIFNNVFYQDANGLHGEGAILDALRCSGYCQPNSLSNIYILNNTFVDYYDGITTAIPKESNTSTASNIVIRNNIWKNCGSAKEGWPILDFAASTNYSQSDFDIDYNVRDAGSLGSNTFSIDGSSYPQNHERTGSVAFQSYVPFSVSNDFHLGGSDTVAKNTGFNLTSLCSTAPQLCYDKDGTSRAATGNWSIGAYEYPSGDTTAPAAPTGLAVN